MNKYSDEKNLDLDPFIFKDNNIAYENALELCSFYKRKKGEIKEDDPIDCNNPYGYGKYLGELIN